MSVEKDPLESLKQEARKYKSAEEFVNSQERLYKGLKTDGTSHSQSYGDAIYASPYEHIAKTYDSGGGVVDMYLKPGSKTINWQDAEYKAVKERFMEQVPGGEAGYRKPNYDKINAELKKRGYDAVTFATDGQSSPMTAILNKEAIQTKQQLADVWEQANKKQSGVHDSLADNLPNQTVRRQVDNVFSLTQQSPVSKDILPQSTDLYNQATQSQPPKSTLTAEKTPKGFGKFNKIDTTKPVDNPVIGRFEQQMAQKGWTGLTMRTSSDLQSLSSRLKSAGHKTGVTTKDFGGSHPLTEVIDNPELYAKYPQLKDVTVLFADFHTPKKYGMVTSDGKTIFINSKLYEKNPEKLNSTIVHEVQHMKQDYRGMKKHDPFNDEPMSYAEKYNSEWEVDARRKQQEYLDWVESQKANPTPVTAPIEKTVDPLESLKQEARKYKSAEEFVKAQGEPLYHGTKSDFAQFDNAKMGSQTDSGMYGKGFYLTPNQKSAKHYAGEKGYIKEVYADMKNPYVINTQADIPDIKVPNKTLEDMRNGPENYSRAFTKYLKDKGYDGVIDNLGVADNQRVVFDANQLKTKQQLTDLYNQAHAEANTKSSNMSDRLSESTDPADIEMRRSLSGKNRPKGAFEIEQNQQMTDEQRLQATGGDIGQTGVASDPVALARAKAKLAEAVKESRAETKKKESKALIQITPTGAKAVDTRNKNIAQGGLPKLEQSQHPQTKQSNPTQTKLANQGKAAQNGNQQSQTGQSPDTQSNHSYAKPIKNFDTKQYIIEQVNAQKVSTKPSIKNMINNFIDKSKHVFVDDAVAYERYIKDKDKRASIREGVDQVRGSSMMARQFAEDNGMNELGKMSTKDLNEFQQYLIAKRSAELEARGIKTGRNLDADQSLIKDVGNKYDTQENIIRDYSNKMLDYSVDNGLISAELRDKLITENPNYVPMNRVMDAVNENSGFKSKQLGSLSQQTVVQKIEGSERTVENPIESLLLNTERMMNESARNRVARQLASESDLTERVINDGDKVRDGYDTLSYLDNGKKVRVEVPALVAQEMRNLNSVMPDWLETSMRLAGAPTKLLRSGATSANPIFAVSNLVRDQIQTAITGKVIANVKGTPKAFVAAFSPSAKGRALRAELRRNGIVGSEYRQTYGSKSGQLMQELQTHNKLGMKAVSKLKHPIESIADVIGATEYFTRAQQFYGTDGDVIARAQAARNNSLNFSRAGVLVRQMNRVIPFLNAGVQGGRITVNTIKNRPVKAAASTATMLGVALAVKALAQAQDDELYERLRDEEKKNNLIIFKPDAHYDPDSNRVEGIVKVPMPQMLYPLLDGVNNVKGKPEDLLRVAGDIFTAVSGIDATNPISQLTPTVVKPAVEIGLNKDLYTGMDLVSDYEKNKNPEDIAAKYGTQPARKLAETTGLPAPYFDNIFKNFGGGLAKDLTLALGKNPDNKRSGKGITGMLEGGLDRRFGSAGITSQYDIQSKLAEGYKDQLRNNSTFKSLSTDDQSKVLDKVDYDTKSIAGIMAKTEQNRNSEIKKDLSDRQKDIVEKGFNPDRFMQSIESGNKGKKDKTDYYKSNDAEYNSFKKEYDDKIKNNEYTKAGKIKAENKLRKLEVGKPYSKDARDLYDINNSQLAKWLSTDEKGVDKQKLHDELIAYDQALYDAGLIKYKKFKGGVATGRNGKGGSRKGGGKSKIDIAQILSKSNLQVQHSQNLSKLLAGTTFKGTKTKPSTSKNKSKVAQKTIKVDMRA